MKSVLSQLNFLKYSKDDFYNYKSEFEEDIILLDNIEQKLNLIRQKISKNAKSSIQNSFEKIDTIKHLVHSSLGCPVISVNHAQGI